MGDTLELMMRVLPGYVVKDRAGNTVMDEHSDPIPESVVAQKYPGYVHAFRACDAKPTPGLRSRAEKRLKDAEAKAPKLNSDTII